MTLATGVHETMSSTKPTGISSSPIVDGKPAILPVKESAEYRPSLTVELTKEVAEVAAKTHIQIGTVRASVNAVLDEFVKTNVLGKVFDLVVADMTAKAKK